MIKISDEAKAEAVNELARDINAWAHLKGFWSFPLNRTADDPQLIPADHPLVKTSKQMLIVTEVAELCEGTRKVAESGIEGFTNEEEELADTIIRCLDYAGQYDLRIGEAIIAKMAKNEKRPYKHGKVL